MPNLLKEFITHIEALQSLEPDAEALRKEIVSLQEKPDKWSKFLKEEENNFQERLFFSDFFSTNRKNLIFNFLKGFFDEQQQKISELDTDNQVLQYIKTSDPRYLVGIPIALATTLSPEMSLMHIWDLLEKRSQFLSEHQSFPAIDKDTLLSEAKEEIRTYAHNQRSIEQKSSSTPLPEEGSVYWTCRKLEQYCEKGVIDKVKLILSDMSPADKKSMIAEGMLSPALYQACYFDHAELVEFLLTIYPSQEERRERIFYCSKDCDQALNHNEVMKVLLRALPSKTKQEDIKEIFKWRVNGMNENQIQPFIDEASRKTRQEMLIYSSKHERLGVINPLVIAEFVDFLKDKNSNQEINVIFDEFRKHLKNNGMKGTDEHFTYLLKQKIKAAYDDVLANHRTAPVPIETTTYTPPSRSLLRGFSIGIANIAPGINSEGERKAKKLNHRMENSDPEKPKFSDSSMRL